MEDCCKQILGLTALEEGVIGVHKNCTLSDAKEHVDDDSKTRLIVDPSLTPLPFLLVLEVAYRIQFCSFSGLGGGLQIYKSFCAWIITAKPYFILQCRD